MVWPFGKQQQQQPEPQVPDFAGALRSVAGFVIGGQRGDAALQQLPGCRVTVAALVDWVRSGQGRDLLLMTEWRRLVGADLGVLSEVAADVVRELGGEVEEPQVENFSVGLDTEKKTDDQAIINQLLTQNPELTELAKLNALLQQDQSSSNQISSDVYAYYNRSNAYSDMNRYEEAIADYTRAIELDSKLAHVYANRGDLYKALKQYETAIADL
ncbi:tetratricopeptide repeat protein [Spirulina major]|uniref:tetratricopeptide repeat protein n=1 Tax=Spirulina major TaxID=270636 RepID=UPI0009353E5E|nr:tetratricopeptide repeat protein [Spirulina major]